MVRETTQVLDSTSYRLPGTVLRKARWGRYLAATDLGWQVLG